MKDKRGQGISMEFIIIAAIALIVLIVIILFFTGGLEKIFAQQSQTVGTATDQEKEIWRSSCRLYCTLGQKENFLNKEFKTKQDTTGTGTAYTCTSLGVSCGDCVDKETLTGAGCSQYRDKDSCGKISQCTWNEWKK
ncbi:MAG: hypothetical protein ABIH63_02555 [archaeon]